VTNNVELERRKAINKIQDFNTGFLLTIDLNS
jgi:hypothetical protein